MATALLVLALLLAIAVVVQEARRRTAQHARETAEASRDAALEQLELSRRTHRTDVARLEAVVAERDRMLDSAREDLRACRDPASLRERLLRSLHPADPAAGARTQLSLQLETTAEPASPAAARA